MYESEYLNELREEVRGKNWAAGVAGAFQETFLVLGQKRLGRAASRSQEAQLKAITNLARLRRMLDRLLNVVSWNDLLNTP